MRTRTTSAALLAAAAVTLPAAPAAADPADAPARGCVSNSDYARLSIGQRLSYVRSVAGDDAQTSMRRWASGAHRYQERLYAMCTPVDSAHATMTARFMYFCGVWRAQIIDTRVGPEE